MARTGRPKTLTGDHERMTVRLPGDVMAQLRMLAIAEERPINTIILRLLRDALTQKHQHHASSP